MPVQQRRDSQCWTTVFRTEEHTTMKLRCESGCKSSLADHPHGQQHQNFVTNTSTAYTQPIQHEESQPMTWRLIELEVHHSPTSIARLWLSCAAADWTYS
jgi:hypothetical protein